jgi:hypothetical protein
MGVVNKKMKRYEKKKNKEQCKAQKRTSTKKGLINGSP